MQKNIFPEEIQISRSCGRNEMIFNTNIFIEDMQYYASMKIAGMP